MTGVGEKKNPAATILLAEDKESMAEMLRQTLETEGYGVVVAATGAEAVSALSRGRFDLVLTDLKMPGASGMEVLSAARREHPGIPVIMMTAFGTIDLAVEAMRRGAYDFLTKPFDLDHLLIKLRTALEGRRLLLENFLLKEECAGRTGSPVILGRSPAIRDAVEKARRVAPGRTTVLLQGESGTGKEIFARAIHALSPRHEKPFVAVNCAAIPLNLLESELFGHEKGAFTGADQRRLGKFELADGGTLFLDEVGELALGLQAKLLRVLQEGEIERVGGGYPVRVDVRVLAASNRDLAAAVESKTFREDLFYRLNVFPITIPSLADRKEDIPILAAHFVERYSRELGRGVKRIGEAAFDALSDHHWKGNVRELENTIERAMILCDSDEIFPEHLGLVPAGGMDILLKKIPMGGSLDETSRAAARIVEAERIRRALKEAGGRKAQAAELLEVSYKTLLTKVKEYGLE